MKPFPTIFVLFLVSACTQESDRSMEITEKTHLIKEVVQEEAESDSVSTQIKHEPNFTDVNGLKQGTWITKGWKDKVVKIETFRNDTLNGYWFNWKGGQEEGYYVNGMKHGYFSTFYGDKSEQSVLHLRLIQNDSVLWHALPAADSRSALPIKGFKVNVDSIVVEAPHYNKSLWYKGLFVNNQPKGVHLIYDENERLLAKTNYADSTIQFTEYASEEFMSLTNSFSHSADWKIIP